MILATDLILAIAATAPDFDTMRFFDFTERSEETQWRQVHDGVMGGLSRGRAEQLDEFVKFAGSVSLENNGGFASFRNGGEVPDLAGYDGVRMRVRGDGQTYKLNFRTDGRWDGVSWQTSFTTKAGEWMTVDLAFEDLVPSWRGRLVTGAPPFDAGQIRQMGIMIADKQAGPYELDLAFVEAWRAKREGAGALAERRSRTQLIAAVLDGESETETLLRSITENENVLVVTARGDLDAKTSKQLGRLLVDGKRIAASELRVVNLMGNRGGRVAGRTLSEEQVRELRKEWNLPANRWAVALVGKDGAVRARWDSLVSAEEIFGAVDPKQGRLGFVGE